MHPRLLGRTVGLITLVVTAAAWGRGQPAAPARADGAGISVALPFELRSNKLAMETMVNAEGPYPFVLDTGAPFTVLDWSLAQTLGLEVMTTGQVGGAGEGSVRLGVTRGVRVSVGDLRYQPNRLEVIPINETLSKAEGREIMGLIGGDVLARFACEFDFGGSRVLLHPSRSFTPPEGAVRLPVTIDGHVLARATITMPGREPITGRFIIDTGARVAVSLNTHVVRQHDLLAGDIPQVRTTIGWGIGGPVEHGLARAEALTLGGITFERPTVTLSSDVRGVFASRAIVGVIGTEVLKRTRMTIDYPREVMYLEARGDEVLRAPFPADASGLFITAEGEGFGVFRVRTVVKDSPAADAGIEPGDVIVRMGTEPASGFSLESLRTLLLEEGRAHEVEVERAGVRRVVRLETRRLF